MTRPSKTPQQPEVGARLLFGGIAAVKGVVARNPKAAITAGIVAGLAAWYCHQRGWITGEHLRAAGRRAASAARPFAERIAAADARRNEGRAALTVVEGPQPASLARAGYIAGLPEVHARYMAGQRPPPMG